MLNVNMCVVGIRTRKWLTAAW